MSKTAKSKSWRDVIKVHSAADLFPMMTPDELKALGEDIKKNGLLIPCVLIEDESGDVQLLDGRNRLDALGLIGEEITLDNSVIFERRDANDFDAIAHVISLNINRRHLTAEQKREVIAKLLKAQPDKSNRTIAEQIKVDHKTVGTVREKLASTGEIPQLDKTVGADGKARVTTPKNKRRDADDFRAEQKAKQQAKAEHRANREAELAAKITALPTKKYGVIYADLPLRFKSWSRETGMDRAADNHYPTMSTDDLCRLPVPDIAAADCVLPVWATVPMLLDVLKVMAAWGFEYRSHVMWDKGRAGTGYWFRNRHELLLIGVRGNPPAPAPGTQWESVVSAPVREHSRKPDCFAEMIEHYFPTLPRIELFCRGPARPGWDAWGNETLPSAPADDGLAIPDFLRRTPEAATP